MIGRIITASTTPTVSIVRPLVDVGPAKNGMNPRLSSSHGYMLLGSDRRQHGDAPQAVDDAGDRGEQVDEVAERLRRASEERSD